MSVSWERPFDFTIEKFDDKKCKSQSFEYGICEKHTQFSITEYGEDEKEAKENLLSELDRFIEMLIEFRNSID